jgi:hypothetical protein
VPFRLWYDTSFSTSQFQSCFQIGPIEVEWENFDTSLLLPLLCPEEWSSGRDGITEETFQSEPNVCLTQPSLTPSSSGNALAGGRIPNHCDNSTWVGYYEDCLDCALDFDIWRIYGNGVGAAAESCGLTASPSPSGDDGEAAAPSSTSAAGDGDDDSESSTSASSADETPAPTTTAEPSGSAVPSDPATTEPPNTESGTTAPTETPTTVYAA